VVVPNVLIRDVPDAVLAAVDAHAARLGLSRVEYIRRRLAADAESAAVAVSGTDLRRFADKFADLGDESVMGDAWR
jgi:sulfite reductase beta subunit-like hemoprotein